MDDAMFDLRAGEPELWRRLDAFAEERLSPDPVVASRMRARVVAVAHRRADPGRADAHLVILPAPGTPLAEATGRRASRRGSAWRRLAPFGLAAAIALAVGGTAFAARPGAPLYEMRLWVETLTLPSDPSARAVAELERLEERLREVTAANAGGDPAGAAAALAAYEAIVDVASSEAILAGDAVASAALEAGVARNITVLQALADKVPDRASEAISAAIERAITRSSQAVDAIGSPTPDRGGGAGGAGAGPDPTDDVGPTPKPTKAPSAKPTKEPKPSVDGGRPETTAEPTPRRTPPGGGKPEKSGGD